MSDMQTMAKAALVAERRKHEAELMLLRQQVADLRAALEAWYATRHTTIKPCDDDGCSHLLCRALHLSELALTQPQEVQP